MIFGFIFALRQIMIRRNLAHNSSLMLSCLPTEIIKHISSLLPLCSVAALTLCSKHFMWMLGNLALRSLRQDTQVSEKIQFLILLEKDMPPHWLLCRSCKVFHPSEQDDLPSAGRLLSEEPTCVRANGIIQVIAGYRLRFHQAQLLMNHSRSGRVPPQYLNKMCDKYEYEFGGTCIKTEIRCIAVLGELLLQVNTKMRLASRSDVDHICWWIPDICVHLKGLYQVKFEEQNVLCQPCHARGTSCPQCSRQRTCEDCLSFYKIEAEDQSDGATKIHINVWKQLGPCTDPFDSKWASQIEKPCLCSKCWVEDAKNTKLLWATHDISSERR